MRRGLVLLLALLGAAMPQPMLAAETAPLLSLALEPHPGTRLPLETVVLDEQPQRAPLARFFTGKPIVIAFEYLRCKTICGVALANLAVAVAALPPKTRGGLRVLAVSIDPRDTPADAAAARRKLLTGAAAALDWHFLTGSEADVRRVAEAAGFHYRYEAATDQYIHSTGYVVAAADGTVSSYLPDLEVSQESLAAAYSSAEVRQIAGPVGRILLLCFGGGSGSGRYTPVIEAAVVLLNLAAMAAAIVIFARRVRQAPGRR